MNCNHCLTPVGSSVTPVCSSAAVPLSNWLGALHRCGSDLILSNVFVISPLVFQGTSVELFGETFQNLPRLNSGFLNTSLQTSRNIQTPKTPSKDISTPSSTPKSQSEATLSPPLSPRPPSKSPQILLLSSKPSSRRSRSSNTFQNKSKSKELPSPLLSPKSVTTRNPNIPVSPKKTAKKQTYRVAKKALIEKLSSPLPPKEPCSPDRPPSHISNKHPSEDEHPASPQTGIFSL